jgi:hypothetical protein
MSEWVSEKRVRSNDLRPVFDELCNLWKDLHLDRVGATANVPQAKLIKAETLTSYLQVVTSPEYTSIDFCRRRVQYVDLLSPISPSNVYFRRGS